MLAGTWQLRRQHRAGPKAGRIAGYTVREGVMARLIIIRYRLHGCFRP